MLPRIAKMKKPRDSGQHMVKAKASKAKVLTVKTPKEKTSKDKVLAVKKLKEKAAKVKLLIEKTSKKKLSKEKTPIEKTPTEKIHLVKKPKQPQKDNTGIVNDDVLRKSIAGLRKLAEIQKTKKALFDDESIIFLQINCIKIPSKPQYLSYVLPYSNVYSDAEICLVPKDIKKGKKADHEPTIELWQELLEKEGVTKVKKVMPLRQLRVEYDQFELQRRLLTLYDTLLVDTRICTYVLQLLGKLKNTRHNIIRPIRLNKGNIKKRIDDVLLKSYFHVNEGPTSTLVVGHCGLKDEQLRDNLEAVIKQLNDKFPGGHNNIRSLEVKLPTSISIPIYLTFKPKSAVKRPKVKITKPGDYVDIEGELSTIPNSTVRITPRGDIIVKRGKRSEIEIEEDDEEFDSSSDIEPETKKAEKVKDVEIEPQPKKEKKEEKGLTKLKDKLKIQTQIKEVSESYDSNSDVDEEDDFVDGSNEENEIEEKEESEPADEASEEEVEIKKSIKVGKTKKKGKLNGYSKGAVEEVKIVKRKGRDKKSS